MFKISKSINDKVFNTIEEARGAIIDHITSNFPFEEATKFESNKDETIFNNYEGIQYRIIKL